VIKIMSGYRTIHSKIEEEQDRLIKMSRDIHSHPEVGGEEFFASDLITTYLEEKGFKVWRGVGGLKTAFMATYGEEGYHVGFCSEYDALPEIGHGCGHNLIAIAAVAAGLALAAALEGRPGRVSVIGFIPVVQHGLMSPPWPAVITGLFFMGKMPMLPSSRGKGATPLML